MAQINEPEWSWRYRAKCRGEETDKWYPPRNRLLYKPIADEAKGVCFGRDGRPECPVRQECLLDALNRDELHGIWGGLSHRERNALVRKAKRSRMNTVSYIDFLEKGGPS